MASKAAQQGKGGESVEELLDTVEQSLDRLRVMYEQYFLGIQKQAPGPLHSDVERRIRDLVQANLRNTATRYRFATIQQKFGSYNAYWRRTLRQIENGTYVRNLSKIGRDAIRAGREIPEEILAAMPKFMREQVQRDRAAAIAREARRKGTSGGAAGAGAGDDAAAEAGDDLLDLGAEPPMELPPEELADVVAMIKESTELRRNVRAQQGPHKISEADGELDIDSFFAAVEAQEAKPATPVGMRQVTRASAAPPNVASAALPSMPAPQRPSQRASQQLPVTQPQPPQGAQPPQRASQPMPPVTPPPRPSQQMPAVQPPPQRISQPLQAQTSPSSRPSQPLQAQTSPSSQPLQAQTSPSMPPVPLQVQTSPSPRPSQPIPSVTRPGSAPPARPTPTPQAGAPAPPPGSAAPRPLAPPRQHTRAQTEPDPPRAAPPARPPVGMTDADVNALYAKYVKAKEMVGEAAGPGAYGKLLKTINAQAPKIMEQYKAKGVDFQVVVKDNQVIIRAKPKP